jgi:hypothetical protein
MRLSGVYYEPNVLAKRLGLGDTASVGLLAQQVQEVFPEAVKPAPIDNNYLTVRYDAIVPTLVQAIKEQQVLLNALKNKIRG